MTFEDLVKVNGTIKTTDIKGKEYAEVNQRIKAFRMIFPEGSIQTELIADDGEKCTFRAYVYSPDEKLLGTGTASENKSASFINKTSYIENCETSAVGRALAMCGIGIDVSIASYEEVKNAVESQEASKGKQVKAPVKKADKVDDSSVEALKNKAKEKNVPIEKILESYKVEKVEDLSTDDWASAMRRLHLTKCVEQA